MYNGNKISTITAMCRLVNGSSVGNRAWIMVGEDWSIGA